MFVEGRTRRQPGFYPARRVLVLLALSAFIPLIIFASWAVFVSAQRSREDARALALLTADRVAERVAGELAKQVDLAEVLASAPSLVSRDLAEFYAHAQRLARARPLWETISLSDRAGTQVLNILRPLGADLAGDPDPVSLSRALNTGRSIIGGLGPIGPLSGKRLVPLRVPVFEAGSLRFILTIGLDPQSIRSILSDAGAPDGWRGAIRDGQGELVADSASSPAGEPRDVSPDRSPLPDVEAVSRSLPGTAGWTVDFSIPRARLDAPVSRSQVLLVGGAGVSLILSALLVALINRELEARRRTEAERTRLALALSEQMGAVAVEAAGLGTWAWDTRARRITCSSRALSMFGVARGCRGARGLGLDVVLAGLHPDDRDLVRVALETGMASDSVTSIEFRADGVGGLRWLRATGRRSPFDGAGGQLVYGVLADIDAEKTAEDKKRQLMRALAVAQENERRRIARELHDQVGQTVTGLILGLKALEQHVSCQAGRQIAALQAAAKEIGQDIHRVSHDLRPTALDDLGLLLAARSLCSDLGGRFGIDIRFQVVGAVTRLDPEVETAIFRSIQEALTNVLKHAQARSVSVLVENRGDELRLIVEDDGKGFDVNLPDLGTGAGSKLGLSGLRERMSLIGGSLSIETGQGRGTALFVTVPKSNPETYDA
jgi:signal transduction histidine kinase